MLICTSEHGVLYADNDAFALTTTRKHLIVIYPAGHLTLEIQHEPKLDRAYRVNRPSGFGDQRHGPYLVVRDARGLETAADDLLSGPPTTEMAGRQGYTDMDGHHEAIHGLLLPAAVQWASVR